MFKVKITPKTVKSEYNWGIAVDIPKRIGIAGDLITGDLIELDTGKQYVITDLIHTGHMAEDVHGYQIHPHDYIGAVHSLPPGSTYKKIVASNSVSYIK